MKIRILHTLFCICFLAATGVRALPTVTITLNGPAIICVELNKPISDPFVTAKDSAGNHYELQVVATSNVNMAVPGKYFITYCLPAGVANAKCVMRAVLVGPVCLPDTVYRDVELYSDSDAIRSQLSSYAASYGLTYTVLGGVNTNKMGTYVLVLIANDSISGGTITKVGIVNVVCHWPPTVILSGPDPLTMCIGDTLEKLMEIKAKGFCDTAEVLSVRMSVGGTASLDTTMGFHIALTAGTAIISFNATDKYGNASIALFRNVTVSACNTGMEEARKESMIFLYPNPAGDQLNISCNPGENLQQIFAFDPAGKEIRIGSEFAGRSQARLDLSTLPIGLYLIRVVTEKKEYHQKIQVLR